MNVKECVEFEVQDQLEPVTEYKPYWRHVDDGPFPRNAKCLWKMDFGAAVIGSWYDGCEWKWWCPLPSHHPKDKERRRNA